LCHNAVAQTLLVLITNPAEHSLFLAFGRAKLDQLLSEFSFSRIAKGIGL